MHCLKGSRGQYSDCLISRNAGYGFAAGCAARLAAPNRGKNALGLRPWFGLSATLYWAKGRTAGIAQASKGQLSGRA